MGEARTGLEQKNVETARAQLLGEDSSAASRSGYDHVAHACLLAFHGSLRVSRDTR
jgi:hypothetical protein